ncbi:MULTISPECIES: hypothetical protein [unclassified Janthinobacterium]|uniref:hypothetical protein n=1 Tax=unclassified Janthinobacterium TaxID=2610881 RepID=UPI000346812F|nr:MULTISPECIES: hypothetical protein [unclassified Janthinobacterium]MEC5160217.1 hypothetical protein [Janthinobacterium sp. CG_S6]
MKYQHATVAASLLSILLAGCGGGDSIASAEGVYEGTIDNAAVHYTVVLEDHEFYTLFGAPLVGGGLAVGGFIQGSGKVDNGNLTSTNLKEFVADGTVLSGTLNTKYVPKTSLNGTVTEGPIEYKFVGSTTLPNSTYLYDTEAKLANIAGAWNLTDLLGKPVTLTVAATGAFTGSSNGCSFSGAMKPRASGKNIFDFTLAFGSAPCSTAGQNASGIAVEYPLANGRRQLLIAGTDASRNHGTAFLGIR